MFSPEVFTLTGAQDLSFTVFFIKQSKFSSSKNRRTRAMGSCTRPPPVLLVNQGTWFPLFPSALCSESFLPVAVQSFYYLVSIACVHDFVPSHPLIELPLCSTGTKDLIQFHSLHHCGAGPVGAGCKQVVGQRLKGSGRRWGEAGADALRQPRALFRGQKGQWDAYRASLAA